MSYTPERQIPSRTARRIPSFDLLKSLVPPTIVLQMIHENLSLAVENLSARMIAIRDSL
jgi:hypothetical protein